MWTPPHVRIENSTFSKKPDNCCTKCGTELIWEDAELGWMAGEGKYVCLRCNPVAPDPLKK